MNPPGYLFVFLFYLVCFLGFEFHKYFGYPDFVNFIFLISLFGTLLSLPYRFIKPRLDYVLAAMGFTFILAQLFPIPDNLPLLLNLIAKFGIFIFILYLLAKIKRRKAVSINPIANRVPLLISSLAMVSSFLMARTIEIKNHSTESIKLNVDERAIILITVEGLEEGMIQTKSFMTKAQLTNHYSLFNIFPVSINTSSHFASFLSFSHEVDHKISYSSDHLDKNENQDDLLVALKKMGFQTYQFGYTTWMDADSMNFSGKFDFINGKKSYAIQFFRTKLPFSLQKSGYLLDQLLRRWVKFLGLESYGTLYGDNIVSSFESTPMPSKSFSYIHLDVRKGFNSKERTPRIKRVLGKLLLAIERKSPEALVIITGDHSKKYNPFNAIAFFTIDPRRPRPHFSDERNSNLNAFKKVVGAHPERSPFTLYSIFSRKLPSGDLVKELSFGFCGNLYKIDLETYFISGPDTGCPNGAELLDDFRNKLIKKLWNY